MFKLTLEQRYASFGLSFSLALLDALKRNEKPKSAVYNRLKNTEEAINKCLDVYQLKAFDSADLEAASKVFDLLEKETKRYFGKITGPKRDDKGRFLKSNDKLEKGEV